MEGGWMGMVMHGGMAAARPGHGNGAAWAWQRLAWGGAPWGACGEALHTGRGVCGEVLHMGAELWGRAPRGRGLRGRVPDVLPTGRGARGRRCRETEAPGQGCLGIMGMGIYGDGWGH